MSKINFLNPTHRCFIIVLLATLSLQSELTIANQLFFLGSLIVSFYLHKIRFRLKHILIAILSVLLLFIQLTIEDYVFSKDYFINIIGLLLIIRFADLDNKKKLFSFSLISLIVCVVSLINSQDIISSLLSLGILVTTIINMYLINQTEIIDLNIKNLIKILSLSLLIVPIVIVIYLIFPRTEVNIKILEASNTNLGIPDEIGLGSFQSFADSTKKVFNLNTTKFNQNDLYFRVKTFDFMMPDKTWISSKEDVLFNQFKQQLSISKPEILQDRFDIILENHNKKWIPTLKGYTISDGVNNYRYSYFNQTHENFKEIEKKKIIQFVKFNQNTIIGNELKEFYLKLPNTISKDLEKWALDNKKDKSNQEYLNFVLNFFNQNNFYYNLSPNVKGKNDYADFFFNSREGYCEYYAGTFVILARLAGIPSRIVSGYYGGSLNKFGQFYEFTQSDAHAWVEVWLDNTGWVRIDPTAAIPPSRIRNTINQYLDQANNNDRAFFSLGLMNIRTYLNYLDYKWTMSFLEYDKQSRDNFLDNVKDKNYLIFLLIFMPFILFRIFRFIMNFNKKNIIRFLFNLMILISPKKNKILNSDTPHQAFEKLNDKTKKKYQNFFKIYLKNIYS
ncbi:DUF3488 and transglutaminase-like domain-containing protein [Candidatus Pelagibacter bacterium]|nr:transglutaminase domain-containing protein [Candidatus Pelagibacter bacterium]MDA8841254.1 DUF3488 and transglutaminase-like domain-containing protein [Candidatus Pelagibacter bacterium]